MARSISRYQGYWELMKANRGQWLELQVPAEFHERVVKALTKRKGREHATTARQYPDFEVVRKSAENILLIRLPKNMIDTI